MSRVPSIVAVSILAFLVASFPGCTRGGDGSRPLLLTSVQNRQVDPDGTTVDFTFNDVMRVSTATNPANFVASGGPLALSAVLLGQTYNRKTVRVTFDELVLPGTATLSVSGVRDDAGNLMDPVAGVAVTSTDTTLPAVSASAMTAVTNVSNDSLTLTFNDRMLPGDVENPANFSFEHPTGTPVTLGGASFTYDEGTRTLTILFAGTGAQTVNLQTGASWQVTMSALRDLGGNSIGASVAIAGTVGGDSGAPALLASTQNTAVDPAGTTVDLAFAEVVGGATATNPANYAASGGQNPVGATVLWPGDMVRVTFDAAVVPGTHTLSVQNVLDLAGNQMAAVPSQAVATPDAAPPSMSAVGATTVSGFANDRIVVTFSEPVLPQEASNLSNYSLQSPTGTPVAIPGSTIAYDEATRTTTITLSASGSTAVNLGTGQSFTLSCSGVRDVAGNPISAAASFAGAVGGDAVAPTVVSVTQNTSADPLGRTVDVLFGEPVALPVSEDASFVASGGQEFVSSMAIEGAMIVRLYFANVMVPGSTSVTISGIEDPAGNVGAASTPPVGSPDVTAPLISASSSTTFAGPGNDRLTLTFNEQVIPSDAVTPGAWALESPTGTPVSLAGASFSFDASTRTTTIALPSETNLQTSATYTLLVTAVRDVAGNSIGSSVASAGVVGGDATAPTVTVADRNEAADPGSRTVDVTFGEALDAASAQTAGNYTITSPGPGNPAVQSATLLLNGQTVRLYLDAAVTPGTHTLDVSGVRDLAGNLMAPVLGVAITL